MSNNEMNLMPNLKMEMYMNSSYGFKLDDTPRMGNEEHIRNYDQFYLPPEVDNIKDGITEFNYCKATKQQHEYNGENINLILSTITQNNQDQNNFAIDAYDYPQLNLKDEFTCTESNRITNTFMDNNSSTKILETNGQAVSKHRFLNTKIHTDEVPYKCETCNKLFLKEEYLARHILIHTREKPFACTNCDQVFQYKSLFDSHLLTHTGAKPFKCTMCEKEFTRQSTLNVHIQTHSSKISLECTHCPKVFYTQISLRAHIKCHTQERSFACSFCEKSFSYKSSLKTHQRIHSGEKPFQCIDCEKIFTTKAILNAHKKTHAAEKPVKCPICRELFRKKYNLYEHIRTHAGDQTQWK